MIELLPPTWSLIHLRCKPCHHEWRDWLPQNVRAQVLIAAMKGFRCPACGSRKVLLMFQTEEPPL